MRFDSSNPLHAALDSINASHGTGIMVEVCYNPGRRMGEYRTLRQYGIGQYQWHLIDGRVYARGTSRTAAPR